MLDLLQLDRDGMVNQVLRQNWKKRTKIDPVLACRDERTMDRIGTAFLICAVVDLGILVVLNFCSEGLAGASICAMVAFVLFLLSIFVKKVYEEKKAVAEFSEALQDLLNVFPFDCLGLARLGEKELRSHALRALCNQAASIQGAEESSEDLAEDQRNTFRRWHQLFRKFDLVGEKWDPFFKQESKDEQAETTGSLDIIRGDEGNLVTDLVQS